ncbi:MAG: polyphosphate kinase 2 family protein [Steroidobacteraceae bacterium]
MSPRIDPGKFRAPNGGFSLARRATSVAPLYKSKEHHAVQLETYKGQLSQLQEMLYAQHTHALLVIFQAMDAAGKDSTIDHVMSGVNPQGCQVFSFKRPSTEELDHDFLWRTNRCLPERGRIGVFNRSYYEEVLVVRVHPQFLAAQHLPAQCSGKHLWRDRYRSILDMEAHLQRSGTCVVKFYLHLSKNEQRERFIKRIDDSDRNWKFNAGDIAERAYWKNYMQAYEQCIEATSTKDSPWYIVPADDKRNMQLIVAATLVDTLESIDPRWPKLPNSGRAELAKLRAQLLGEKD